MGFIDFLKKLIEKNRTKESERETEKVAFDEIGDWVENKGKEIKDKEKEVFVLIQEKINFFINELKEKADILESIDVDSIKTKDKIKSIVNEGREKYLEKIKDFSESLSILKKNNLEEFILDVNKLYYNFSKSSRMSYERTTILIGKEIDDIKERVIGFSKYLTKTFDKNKDIINSSKIISFIKLKLKHVIEMERILKEIDESITSLDKKITEKKQENKEIIEEIEKIKKEKSYIENLKKQEKIKLLEGALEKDIFSLRQLIDFKALANFFHIFEEQMNIVKSHKEDFQTNFQGDGGASILILLDEAKLNNEAISAKIKQINDKKDEIIKNKATIKKDEIEDLLAEIKKIKLEIEKLNNEKAKKLKRGERLKISREKIINSIKQGLAKINVIISDV